MSTGSEGRCSEVDFPFEDTVTPVSPAAISRVEEKREEILRKARTVARIRLTCPNYAALARWRDERMIPWVLDGRTIALYGNVVAEPFPFRLDIDSQEVVWNVPSVIRPTERQHERATLWNIAVASYEEELTREYDGCRYGKCLSLFNKCLDECIELASMLPGFNE